MAVAVQLDFPGATLAQYDAINELIGRFPGGPASRHELFHWVTATDEGFRVVDVWESRESFEGFLRDTLRPVFQEVGVPTAPTVQVFEVHNYSVGARWRD